MNDRIYELAEQAAEFTDANEFAAIERRIWDSIFRNKFAELIVKECADTAENCFVYWPMDGSLQRTGCANAIKKHFGVE